jgi:hypothetical protein
LERENVALKGKFATPKALSMVIMLCLNCQIYKVLKKIGS